MDFASKLHELRKQNHLSQEALAQKLDVSRQAVSKWESGTSMPETEKLIRISEFFGVSLDELIGREPVKVSSSAKNGPVLMICGVVALLLWMTLEVSDYRKATASSVIMVDGNGMLFILAGILIFSGVFLTVKTMKRRK